MSDRDNSTEDSAAAGSAAEGNVHGEDGDDDALDGIVDQSPDIDPNKCVFSRLDDASCRACLNVCPHGAVVLTDESLGIDMIRCYGCGHCIAACPEAAIANDNQQVLLTVDRKMALYACYVAVPEIGTGIRPCLQALDRRELARLATEGIETIAVARGDCSTCSRGRSPATFETALADVNRLLESREMDSLSARVIAAGDWGEAIARSRQRAGGPSLSRRALFRRIAVPVAADEAEKTPGLFDVPEVALYDLPEKGEARLYASVPVIDPQRCTACHACVRICPHGALALVVDDIGNCYKIDPARCSSCRLCIDVCADSAIALDAFAPAGEGRVALESGRCGACGQKFHASAENARSGTGLCRICGVNNTYKNLYQVIE